MSELKNLQKASIREFQDNRRNSTAIPCLLLPGQDGMGYLVKDLANKIEVSAAIHISAEVKAAEDGIYDTGYVSVDTQDDLFAQFEEQPQVVILNLVHVGDQYRMGYTGRTNPFSVGQTVVGAISKASGLIGQTTIDDTAPASGMLYLRKVTGSFQDGEDLIAGSTRCALSSLYDGFIIGISKSGEFNERAGTWHYVGELLLTRNSQFVIVETPETFAQILTDSTTLWLGLSDDLGIPVFPSFISPVNVKDPYISVMVNSSKPLGPVLQTGNNVLKQNKKDSVRLYLINSTADQAQQLQQIIWNEPLKNMTFGISNFIGWQMIPDRTQPGLGIKQNIRTMDIEINYWLYTNTAKIMVYIRKVAAQISFMNRGNLAEAAIRNY